MTEDEVVQVLHAYFASLFPKVCPSCNRVFATLLEYIQVTKRLGMPISYDANDEGWNTTAPIGAAAFANCPCGTTLSLTTEYLELAKRLELLNWVRTETRRRGMEPSKLLEHLRNVIRSRVLDAPVHSAEALQGSARGGVTAGRTCP